MDDPDTTIETILEQATASGVDPGEAFWPRYFAACPEAEERMVHMDEHMRGRMLASVFDLLMIEDEAERRAFLAFEIGNHDAYGARLPMYEALFAALRDALCLGTGDRWSAAAERRYARRTEQLMELIALTTRREG